MSRFPTTLTERIRGLLLGLAAGRARAGARLDADGPLLLATALAGELLAPRVDFQRIAERWLAIAAAGAAGLSPATRRGLAELERTGAPPTGNGGPPGAGPLAHCVPIAALAAGDPGTLVSGTYHAAALSDPDPRTAWAAVAVNVAAARLLLERRDFAADVIEALKANDAPADLVAAARRVPLEITPPAGGDPDDPIRAVELALRIAYREPLVARGLDSLAAAGEYGALGPAGALLGARDGAAALPPLDPADAAPLESLAARIAARIGA